MSKIMFKSGEYGSEKYSTAEKAVGTWIDGKTVYRKVISFGAVPNNATKSVSIGVSNLSQVVNIHGFAVSTGATIPLPYPTLNTDQMIMVYVSSGKIYVKTTYSGFGDYTASYFIVEYTKTS